MDNQTPTLGAQAEKESDCVRVGTRGAERPLYGGVRVTPIERSLAIALAASPGVTVTRDTLLVAMAGPQRRPCSRVVDVHVARLRRKMADASTGVRIVSIRNEGYQWVPKGRAEGTTPCVRIGSLEIDVAARTVRLESRLVAVTSYELKLIVALVERRGRCVSRAELCSLTGCSVGRGGARALDVHVSRLREKLGDRARPHGVIQTIPGLGWRVPAAA